MTRFFIRIWNALRHTRRRRAYTAYLHSPQWRVLRLQVLKRDGWRCQQCGDTQSLEVHHLTYKRFGRERLSDLLTLCHSCHRAVHRRKAGRRVAA